jgi:hypothetical protein
MHLVVNLLEHLETVLIVDLSIVEQGLVVVMVVMVKSGFLLKEAQPHVAHR